MPTDIKDITPEDITDTYKKGYISATKKNDLMRRKAESTVAEMLDEKGYLGAIMERSIQHLNEGWENIKEAATHDTGESAAKNFKAVGQAFWGQIQVLTSVMNAFGEVNGAGAEKLALWGGASPGLAKIINVAVDVGSGFVPVGTAARSAAKGVQAIGKAKQAGKAATAATKAAEQAAKAEAKQAEKVIDDAIDEGLKADGVFTSAKEPAAVSEEVMRRGKEFLGKDPISDFMEGVKKRWDQEAAGQSVLDFLEETGRTPQQVVKDFWEKTYDKLPPEVQKRFQQYIKKETGLEPGATIAVGPKGEKTAAKTWQDVYPHDQPPLDPTHLEGTERGLISLMEMANHGAGAQAAQTATKAIEQAAKQITPQEAFTKSLQKYKREMEEITERKAHATTLAEANKLGIGIEDLRTLQPGTALKESEMAAYLKALDEPVDDLVAWAKKTLAGEDGAGEVMSKKLVEFFSYSPKFRAAEVTAGRSVEILKETPPMKAITDMLMGLAPEALAKGDFKAAMQTVAEDIVAMGEQAGKLKALQINAAQTIQATGWKRFNEVSREVYYNTLLARPLTQVRNFVGNMYKAMELTGERALGSMFSLEKKNLYDRANPLTNEGYHQFNGYLAGIGDGLKAYAQAFKSFTPEEASKLDFIPHKIGGVMGRFINAPSDALRGMDGFFKAILHRGDLYAQATSKGLAAGLKGNELADYIARRANFPSTEMVEQAKKFAQDGTFQNDLGVLGSRLQSLMQAGPLWTLFPFMKTPMNLTKSVWNHTPGLQLTSKSLYQDILAGGSRADMAIGRLTLSNLSGMFLYGLAQQGLITGGGPADPRLRRSWLGDHQPYSIKTKDGWIQPGQLDPGTTPAFIMADFAEIANQLDEGSMGELGLALGIAATRDIVDKSYWQSIGDLHDLTSSISTGEFGKEIIEIAGVPVPKVLAQPLATQTTGGPMVGSIARIMDPVRREQRSFVDMWRARVPGFSKELAPVRDGYGDPILIPQAVGNKWLGVISPFTASQIDVNEDVKKIKEEGGRLQVKLPMFPWSLGGKAQDDFDIRSAQPGDPLPIELSSKERDRWQVIYRNFINSPEMGIKTAILDTEQYKTGTYALQRQMFMSYLANARNGAKHTLLAEDKDLAKRAFNAKMSEDLPLVQPSERAGAEQQINESLDLIDGLSPEQQDNLMKWGLLDSGEARDVEVIHGIRAEINKPLSELNVGASQQSQSPSKAQTAPAQ